VDLTVCWAAIIAAGVLMYVMLDGFDLGIGIIFPLFADEHDRDLMMSTVAPVWDGNETWLVLGGAGLFAAFPMVYSVILSALYLPLIFMLACLIFRGVSFEIRAKANRTKPLWDLAFMGGSIGATFFQGVTLGGFLNGIVVTQGRFSGDAFAWFTPFGLFVGLALTVTYALLGCCWLILKTEGPLQRRFYRIAWPLTLLQLCTIAVISIWTPLQENSIALRWFDSPWFYRLLPVPLLILGCAWLMFNSVRSRHETRPFLVALLFVFLGFGGLVASISPHAIFPGVSLWDAAAPRSSQLFTLIGAVIILPMIAAYTTLGYWVFKGKVRHGETHYH
jgi:cytochrome d ubiquinol oxidase subunit II